MSEKNTSQAQHTAKKVAGAFGMDNVWGFDAWKKIADENVGRASQWWEEMAKLEKTGFEQATRAVDESAKLVHETLTYSAQLSAELRKMAFDAAKRSFEALNPQH